MTFFLGEEEILPSTGLRLMTMSEWTVLMLSPVAEVTERSWSRTMVR